ncbi:hypothetical protein QTO34_016770, partial [Cnephaeus nilssonii]
MPQRGSDESVFSRGRRWIRTRTQRQGRLWPFSRRRHSEVTQEVCSGQATALIPPEQPMSPPVFWGAHPAKERPKQVKEEPQLVMKTPAPPSREGPGEGLLHRATQAPPASNLEALSPNRRMALFNSVLQCCACGNRTRTEDLEPKEAEPKGEKWAHQPRGQTAPPVTSKVHPEEGAELSELEDSRARAPPAASPAAAVEPGPAPDITEAPPALEEEPSPGPLLVPASEEELPVEAPTQGPPVECPHPVPRGKLVCPPLLDISVFFIVLILFLCSPWRTFFFDLFITLGVW